MEKNDIIDSILFEHSGALQDDFEKYKNHVYRVYCICKLLDPDRGNNNKYAIAAVFHDLGIWSDKTFDYLAPSISLATDYLNAKNNNGWVNEIAMMIDMHHKASRYIGEFETTVETFRKADWVDVSRAIVTFGADKNEIRKIFKAFPTLGFHRYLLKRTVSNFFSHPLNPLPMFKK